MGYALLTEKPRPGENFLSSPKTAIERAASRWFERKKSHLSLRCTSGQLLTAEYIYNDAGQRTRKTVYQSDGITIDSITIYHYDQQGYLISETDEQGNLIRDYIWSGNMTPVAQIDNNNGTETITYLHTDHLYTNRLATDENQTIVWRWEGEAFGNTPAQELGNVQVNLRFPGQYYDKESNLFYNRYRYYSPDLGRYITSDPIGLGGGMNTYFYADVNPIAMFDSKGLTTSSQYTYGEVRQWAIMGMSDFAAPSGLPDAKESIGAACSRGNPCASGQPGPKAAPADKAAGKNIDNATGGKDLTGGGNFMCVGTMNCWYVTKRYKCVSGKKTLVPRSYSLVSSGRVGLRGNAIYFYKDPLRGWCNKHDYINGCSKCMP